MNTDLKAYLQVLRDRVPLLFRLGLLVLAHCAVVDSYKILASHSGEDLQDKQIRIVPPD